MDVSDEEYPNPVQISSESFLGYLDTEDLPCGQRMTSSDQRSENASLADKSENLPEWAARDVPANSPGESSVKLEMCHL